MRSNKNNPKNSFSYISPLNSSYLAINFFRETFNKPVVHIQNQHTITDGYFDNSLIYLRT